MSNGASFASGFAQGFADTYELGMRLEQNKVNSQVRNFLSNKDAYLAEQEKDRKLIEQAKQLAESYGQSNVYQDSENPLDTNVLWVNAYQLLKAGDTVDNVKEQLRRGKFTPEEGMYDPLDQSASTARLPANLQNPTQMRDAATDIKDSMSEQMTDLGFDSDELWNRVLTTESNNTHFQKDGRVTTSPKGALGAAQIMPQTAMQPGNNVPTIFEMARDMNIPVGAETEEVAKELLANEDLNRKFGRAYFDAMQTRFDGDPAKILIAYNAGPDVAEAYSGDRSVLPTETQGYLAKNLGLVDTVNPAESVSPESPVSSEKEETSGGLMSRLFGDMFAGEQVRVRNSVLEQLGVTEEEYARYTSPYSTPAFGKGYKFEPFFDPEDLPEYMDLSKATQSKIDGFIAAAETDVQRGVANAPAALASLQELKRGYNMDWADPAQITDSNFIGGRIAAEQNLARLEDTGTATEKELEQAREYVENYTLYEQRSIADPDKDYLEGLNDNNWLVKFTQAMSAGKPEQARSIIEITLENAVEIPNNDHEVWMASQQARFNTMISALQQNADNAKTAPEKAAAQAAVERVQQQLDFFTGTVVPEVDEILAGTRAPIEELSSSQISFRLANGHYEDETERAELESLLTIQQEEAVAEQGIERMGEGVSVLIKNADDTLSARLGQRGFDRSTGNNTYIGYDGSSLLGEGASIVREITPEESDAIQRGITSISEPISTYDNARAKFIEVLNPGMEALSILEQNPEVLTTVGGFTTFFERIKTELKSVERLSTEQIDGFVRDAFNLDAAETGIGFAGRLANSADATSRFRSKILLMAYRIGGAEGQTGQGMSNKDFDRFMQVIRSSSNSRTFATNLMSFLNEKKEGVNRLAVGLQNNPTVRDLNSRYADNPRMVALLDGFKNVDDYYEMLNKSKTRTDGSFDHYGYYSKLNLASFGEDASVVPAADAAPSIVTNVDQFNTAFNDPNVRSFDLRFETQEELDAFMAANPGAVDVNGNALRLDTSYPINK